MTNFAWCVVENIAWCAAFLCCAMFLPDWWKMLSLAPLAFVNVRYRENK